MLIGIVGKPSCGKSTFFKSATLADAEIAAYPFTTIKPNHGVGFVRIECVDKGFNRQCNPRFGSCRDGIRFVPVDLLDVAGLVPGAHEGLGMGNQFLDDLRQADVLIHVIDISGSTNEKGDMVAPLSYDPVKDVEFLEFELDMWYYGVLQKIWVKLARQLVQEKGRVKSALAKQLSAFKVTEPMVESVMRQLHLSAESPDKWTDTEVRALTAELRHRTKPMVIACNKIDVPGAKANFERLQTQFPNHILIPCSAESELALREATRHGLIDYIPGNANFIIKEEGKLTENQKKGLELIQTHVLDVFKGTGVQTTLNTAVFNLLKYIAIFPGGVTKLEDKDGNVLPDCFLLPGNSTALDFAYKLHTDLGDHFIRAIDVKTKRTVGREHALQHRDVIEIITSR